MSNLLPDRTTSEYVVEEIESTEPPPPYSEYPTANNNNELSNGYIHNHNSSIPEQPISPPTHFTQQPLPHPNMRSHFPSPNEYPPPSVPTPNVHLQLPLPFPTQFSHPNFRTPLLPTTYFPPMHSPIHETQPFLPSYSHSGRPIERVYSASQRAMTRQVIENEDDCCCTAPCEISTWGCLIYLILFSLPFGLFCFIWIITTSVACFATLILPPLGYMVCLITAASYRMLGRIELITQQLCGGQPRLFRVLGYQAYPPVFSIGENPSLFSISSLQPQGWFSSSLNYITDAYTWRCLIYFLIIKSFLSIITFIVTIFAVIFSIPLALCLLGPALYLVKTIGVWQKEVAFEFLA